MAEKAGDMRWNWVRLVAFLVTTFLFADHALSFSLVTANY